VFEYDFIYLDYVHFFCSSKRNEPKKRRPEKTTTPCLSARCTSLKGATKQGVVRTFSGLPTHHFNTNHLIVFDLRVSEAPKLSGALNFLWLLSLFQDKESNDLKTDFY
jgi:hypothetical protein